MIDASLAEKTAPFVLTRSAAIVHAAIFDAINGIEPRYKPIHVSGYAPRGTSRRAAVVQAAYGTLVELFPTQRSTFDSKRWVSLEEIVNDAKCGRCVSIDRGLDWGQKVADEILAWRSTDGFTTSYPPFLGGDSAGQWRPTPPPPACVAGVGVPFAHMTPWVLDSPSQFRLDGPPALTGAQYAADFNETMAMGNDASPSSRTPDQTLLARFWNGDTVTYLWGRVAASLVRRQNNSLLENARLFAQLSLAMADAVIATWDTKYTYAFWRPVTAVRFAAADGNPATMPDPAWTPLLTTPCHPEYPSAHSTLSTAAATVLASYFGGKTTFTVDSSLLPGVQRTFNSFSDALNELADARVFGGMHFRTSCEQGRALGRKVGKYVLLHSCRPSHRGRLGEFDFDKSALDDEESN
jgi:hypothetical protein